MRTTNTVLAGLIRALGLLICAATCGADGPAREHITILSTTDLHGNSYPIDYDTNSHIPTTPTNNWRLLPLGAQASLPASFR